MSHEKRLIQDLIRNYKELGIMGRPVRDQNDTITIKYGLSLIQILDLDERNQILTTNVWATYVSCGKLSSKLANRCAWVTSA